MKETASQNWVTKTIAILAIVAVVFYIFLNRTAIGKHIYAIGGNAEAAKLSGINIDKTIIISSHILSELAEMCTTIGIIDHGQMMVKETVDEIMTWLNTSNPLQIRIVEGMDQAVKILKENPTVVNLSVDANMLLVGFKGNEEEEAALLASLIQNDVRVSSFVRDTGNLEEVFMRVTGNKEVLSA